MYVPVAMSEKKKKKEEKYVQSILNVSNFIRV